MEAVAEIPKHLAFDFNSNIPEKHKENIKKAYYLLKNEGCKNVYLFGSMVTGKIHAHSDIDIGIKGIPEGNFLGIYAKLLFNLNIKFDLVNFDFDHQLFELLDSLGEVVEIGR